MTEQLQDSTADADTEALEWARVRALCDELTDEENIKLFYRQFATSLEGTSYREVPAEEFFLRFRLDFLEMMEGVRQRRIPGPADDGQELQATGRTRALRGVELSDLVQITLVVQGTFGMDISRRTRARGISDRTTVEVLQYLDAWHAWSMKEVIAGYQEAALELATRDHRRKDNALRQLLGGELTPVEMRRAAADSLLDPHRYYYVLRAVPDGRSFNDVRRALSGESYSAHEEAVFTTMYGDLVGVSSTIPPGPVPFLVGVSSPVTVTDLAEGFRLATRSADAARQLGMDGLVSMRDLSVAASVATDHELVEILTARYLEPLNAAGLSSQAILDTVAQYLRYNRSVVDASKAMFVHANTVRYRVERFESVTRSSLKDMRTLTEVWWILRLFGH